jgi:anti-sigma factor RsiW
MMHLGERLTDLLDGRLDPRAEADAVRHLETCAACRTELDDLRAARAFVRRAEAPAARAAFWTRLARRLDEERIRLERRRWAVRLLIPAMLAIAAAVAIALMPPGQVPVSVNGYIYEHARYRARHSLSDEAVVTLVGTDASLELELEVYGR